MMMRKKIHALFKCTWVKLLWEELKQTVSTRIPPLHPNSWAADLVDGTVLQKSEASMVLCGTWAICTERNNRRHGEGQRPIKESIRWVIETSFDLSKLGREKMSKPRVKEKWEPQNHDCLKINTDARLVEANNEGCTGLVVRDDQCKLIRAQARWFEYAASAMVMETYDIREVLRLTADARRRWQSYAIVKIKTIQKFLQFFRRLEI
jgi:hypothetical protein